MLLYKDVFTDKDVFSDAFRNKLIDDLYYLVEGKIICEDSTIDESMIGGNKSEEAVEDDSELSNATLVPNVVSSNKLEEIPTISTKTDFKNAIKVYMGKLLAHVKAKDPERAQVLKGKLNEFVKELLSKFKTFTWYATEDDAFELEGIIIPLSYEADGGKIGEGCQLIIFKDGLYEEKC